MQTKFIRAAAAVCVLLALSSALAQGTQAGRNSPSPNSDVVVCTALEVHANAQSGTTIVVIHQQRKSDQGKFAALLAHADGNAVQIQVEQGPWVAASIIRLRSCFGRGLVMFSSAELTLAAHDTLNVKFSAPRLTAERVPDARN